MGKQITNEKRINSIQRTVEYGDITYYRWCELECERLNEMPEWRHKVMKKGDECWIERFKK